MDEFEKLFCWLVPVPYIHKSERGLAFGLQLSLALALALALAVALVGRIRAKTRKLDLFQVFYREEIGFSPLYHLSYFSQYVYMYFRSFCLNYSFLDHIMTISPDSTFLDDNMLSMKERKLFCINFEIVFIYRHVACVL